MPVRLLKGDSAVPVLGNVACPCPGTTATRCLGRGCLSFPEQRFGLRECGPVAHRCEELARFGERSVRGGIAERVETAALAEQGVGAFGDVPKLVPAVGRVGVEAGRFGVVGGCFGELGLAARWSMNALLVAHSTIETGSRFARMTREREREALRRELAEQSTLTLMDAIRHRVAELSADDREDDPRAE
jgi:hypothetical protein